jgi:ribose-phosphate pyrophosphokinase
MGLVLALPGVGRLARQTAKAASWRFARIATRRFPDGETFLRVPTGVEGADCALFCSLARPDSRFLALAFAARELRERGAGSLTLVAPYLPYLRQDRRFREDEALTSRHFAALVSREFDRLVTVDPHLHRIRDLDGIYSIPTITLHSAPLLAAWIRDHVRQPFIVGPDEESEQWVKRIASEVGAPFAVLAKQRLGDRSVVIRASGLDRWRRHRPILIDDIISSGGTIIEAIRCLEAEGFAKPVCIAIHALARPAIRRKIEAATVELLSTDTVPHPSNKISVAPLLADALRRLAPLGSEHRPLTD